MKEDVSIRDFRFLYRIGKEVKVDNYDEDIDAVCTSGIHYFKTKEAAESWWCRAFCAYSINGVLESGMKMEE